ncbi:MAG: DUF87 domain-containing protein [Candidatus Woesearchaeota archaeon]
MSDLIKINNYDLIKVDEMLQFTIQRRELDINDPNKIIFKPLESWAVIDPYKYSKFFTIKSVNKNEDDIHSGLNAITQILSLFRDGRNSFIFVLSSDKEIVTFSLGTLPAPGNQDENELNIQRKIFEKVLHQTNYGLELDENNYSHQAMDKIIKSSDTIACITGVPGIFSEDDKKLSLRIDDFINSTQGEEFTLIGIFEPIPIYVLDEMIIRCNDIRTGAANISKFSIQEGAQITLTQSTNNTYTTTQSYTYGKAWGESKGYSFNAAPIGGAVVGAIGFALGGPIGFAVGAAIGGGIFGGFTKSKNTFQSQNESWSESFGRSITETKGESRTQIESITRELFNKSAERTDKIAKDLIERLEIGKERGMWDTGIYILAKEPEVVKNVANVLKSKISGFGSRIEPIRVNYLIKNKMDSLSHINFTTSLHYLRNPKAKHSGHPLGIVYEGLSTPLTGKEIPILFNFPRYDVKGIKVIRRARYLPEIIQENNEKDISVGKIFDGAKLLDSETYINLDSLKHHTFICGVTGSGKTVTCLNILSKIIEKNPDIKILVIEPAKNQYRTLFSKDKNIKIYTLGNEKTEEKLLSFRFNPFYPVRIKYKNKWKISNIQAHIDYIKSAIISALPMEVAMPAILSEAITKSYKDYGWDLSTSTNIYFEDIEKVDDITDYIPTMIDVRNNIDIIVDSKGFDIRLNMDYKAALKARLDGLCDGAKGVMLNTRNHIEISKILENNTILELDNIADPSEKAIIMGIIMGAIYEYRKLENIYKDQSNHIKHITLIEEAHHLLTNFKVTENQEISAARSKLVELFSNILSEIRAYGEGFIIVEQIPSKLLGDVIKNTSTKIVHKMIDGEERKLLAYALVLSNEQEEDLPFLKQGECIFINEQLHSAQRIKVEDFNAEDFDREKYLNSNIDFDTFISNNQKNLIDDYSRKYELNSQELLKCIQKENNEIRYDIIRPEKISMATIFNLIVLNQHIIKYGEYLEKINPLPNKPQNYFFALDDRAKALALAFAITNVLRNYFIIKRKEKIKDVIEFINILEKLFVDEIFINYNSLDDYKSNELRKKLKENLIVNEPMFNYLGCSNCQFKCKYGLYVPNLLDPIIMKNKIKDGNPFNYHIYLKNLIIENYPDINGNHLNEMLYCLKSTFSEYNSEVLNKLLDIV